MKREREDNIQVTTHHAVTEDTSLNFAATEYLVKSKSQMREYEVFVVWNLQ